MKIKYVYVHLETEEKKICQWQLGVQHTYTHTPFEVKLIFLLQHRLFIFLLCFQKN